MTTWTSAEAFAAALRAALPVVARCQACGREYVAYPDWTAPCAWPTPMQPDRACGGRVVPVVLDTTGTGTDSPTAPEARVTRPSRRRYCGPCDRWLGWRHRDCPFCGADTEFVRGAGR